MFVKAYNHTGRNRALDALRGFALFGVLIANIYLFNCYSGDLPAYLSTFSDKTNILTSFVVQFFFRGRFYPIFALLFGLGMGIQFLKQSNTEAAYKLLLRRLLVLLLIGILHYVFVWDGDIFFFVQACLSYWWLRHHAQGPLEKFWRFLTYNRTAPEVSVK